MHYVVMALPLVMFLVALLLTRWFDRRDSDPIRW